MKPNFYVIVEGLLRGEKLYVSQFNDFLTDPKIDLSEKIITDINFILNLEAEKDNVYALWALALMHIYGIGTIKNYIKSIALLERAVELNNSLAMNA